MIEKHQQATCGFVSLWQISPYALSAYESDFKAVLILKESLLPVVETQHQVLWLLNALRHV